MDMTRVSTAARPRVYLRVIVDCCTCEVCGWTMDMGTRSTEAITCVEALLLKRRVSAKMLTLGTETVPSSPYGVYVGILPLMEVRTAVAASVTPSTKRSSSPGLGSSNSSVPGVSNGKPSTRSEPRPSTLAATATATGPTLGSVT
jgi:putative transposase